jgi:hypothetical protein
MITITCPIDKRLHSHNKGYWRDKSAAVKQARQLARLLALEQPVRAIVGKAIVDYLFFVPDKRRRDAANLVQSCKPLVDGVVDSGLISGDHWEVLAIGKVDVVLGAKLEVQLTFRAVKQCEICEGKGGYAIVGSTGPGQLCPRCKGSGQSSI